jgi:hypothetical protein
MGLLSPVIMFIRQRNCRVSHMGLKDGARLWNLGVEAGWTGVECRITGADDDIDNLIDFIIDQDAFYHLGIPDRIYFREVNQAIFAKLRGIVS